MDARLTALCAQQVRGDTYRNLAVHAEHSGQTFKHILAPVWLLSDAYGTRAFQCAMRRVTGAVRGQYPESPSKIALHAVGVVVLVLIFTSFAARP